MPRAASQADSPAPDQRDIDTAPGLLEATVALGEPTRADCWDSTVAVLPQGLAPPSRRRARRGRTGSLVMLACTLFFVVAASWWWQSGDEEPGPKDAVPVAGFVPAATIGMPQISKPVPAQVPQSRDVQHLSKHRREPRPWTIPGASRLWFFKVLYRPTFRRRRFAPRRARARPRLPTTVLVPPPAASSAADDAASFDASTQAAAPARADSRPTAASPRASGWPECSSRRGSRDRRRNPGDPRDRAGRCRHRFCRRKPRQACRSRPRDRAASGPLQRADPQVLPRLPASGGGCLPQERMSMRRSLPKPRRLAGLALAAALAGAIGGCAAPPPPPRVAIGAEAMPFDQAIDLATAVLMQDLPETQAGSLARSGAAPREVVVLDPTLDAASGQQTARHPATRPGACRAHGAPRAEAGTARIRRSQPGTCALLMTGTLQREKAGFRFQLSLVDLRSGVVASHASALSGARHRHESAGLLPRQPGAGEGRRDRRLHPDQRDAHRTEGRRHLPGAHRHRGRDPRCDRALQRRPLSKTRWRAIAAPWPCRLAKKLRVSTVSISARQARPVRQGGGSVRSCGGLRHSRRQLGVKFLFNPGSTEFWSDPKVSAAYGMWLRQIVRQAASAKVCMNVVGHTSATGSESVNDALSLKRALFIKQRWARSRGNSRRA